VETPRKFITAKLSIRKPGSSSVLIICDFTQITTLLYIKKRACELNKSHIISTDEDPGLRIESFAVTNLRGVSTNKTIIYFIAMQTYKELVTSCSNNLLLSCNSTICQQVVSDNLVAT
jgi:hypothetical protein